MHAALVLWMLPESRGLDNAGLTVLADRLQGEGDPRGEALARVMAGQLLPDDLIVKAMRRRPERLIQIRRTRWRSIVQAIGRIRMHPAAIADLAADARASRGRAR